MELVDHFFQRVVALEKRQLLQLEKKDMADFTKLMADIAALDAKVTELLAKQAPVPVDEQPAVDTADAAVAAIAAKIPA